MTAGTRLRLAEAGAGLVVLSMFLPWSSEDRGIETPEGQLMLLTGVAIIVLVRLGSRIAWIAAGFAVAVMAREALAPEAGTSTGFGLWIGLLAALTALVVLVWNMFAEVQANRPDRGG